MTKVRAPLTFGAAIKLVAGAIGPEKAAELTGRAARTVQHWGDTDNQGLPTLDQAFALDREFIKQGGGYAPLLESYSRQMEVSFADAIVCRDGLADAIANATREAGEAFALCIQAMQPGASPALIFRALTETEEADALFAPLLGWLRASLPGNGAVQGQLGER